MNPTQMPPKGYRYMTSSTNVLAPAPGWRAWCWRLWGRIQGEAG